MDPATATPEHPGAAERHRSAAIDALRAVAAVSVLVFHTSAFTGQPTAGVPRALLRNLDAGLVLFFVLSGYLISGPFVRALVGGRATPDLGRYALRRACRILPAFWVALAATALLLPAAPGGTGASGVEHWWQLPVHALLLQNLVPGQVQSLLKVDWTLENELLFYLLVPLGAWAAARSTRRRTTPERLAAMAAAVWAASGLTAFAADQVAPFTTGSVIARYTLPSVVGLFCPGIIVAVALTPAGRRAGGIPGAVNRLLARPRLTLASASALTVIGLVAWQASGSTTRRPYFLDVRWQLFAAACGLVLGVMVTHGGRVHRFSRLLAPIGLVSYGIYLWHTIVIRVLSSTGFHLSAVHGSGTGLLVNAALVLGLTLVPATVSYRLVERPALRWSGRRSLRPRASLAPIAAEATP